MTFILCYIPVTSYLIYEIATGNVVTTWSETYLELTASLIAMSNNFWNPLVYYWRLKFARQATVKLFSSCLCCLRVESNEVKSPYTSKGVYTVYTVELTHL